MLKRASGLSPLFLIPLVLVLTVIGTAAATAQEPESVADDRADILLFEAETYLQEGRYRDAIPVLERLLVENPDRVDARESLVLAYRIWLTTVTDPPPELVRKAIAIYGEMLDLEPRNGPALDGVRMLSDRFNGPALTLLKGRQARASWDTATRAFDEQRFADAVTALRAVIAAEPDVPQVHRKLAEALRRSGASDDEVRMSYARTLNLNSGDVAALSAIAEMDAEMGLVERAEKTLRKAFELDESYGPTRVLLGRMEDSLAVSHPHPERFFYLGRLRLADKDYGGAVEYLKQAAELDSTSLDYTKYLGIAYFKQGNINDALGLLQEVREANPEDPDARYYIGSLLFDLRHYGLVVQELTPIASYGRYRGKIARMLGLSLARVQAHPDLAIVYLEQAIREGADDENLPCILGEQYVRVENWDDAERNFRKCLKDVPDHPAALLGLGLAADHAGRHAEAIDWLERFSADHPTAPSVLIRLGLSYLKDGRPDSAVARLRTAVLSDTAFSSLIGPDVRDTDILEIVFLVLMSGKNREDGIVVGEHLAKLTPENASYANNLAMAYADAGVNLDRALALARDANKRVPDNAGFLDTLGWTFARMRRFGEARKTLERAVELAKTEERRDLAEIYYHLGYLHAEMNQKEEAVAYLQMILEDDPNPLIEEAARELLEKLQAD